MYSLKIELKLNNKERSKLAGCAGFSRLVYNFGLSLLTKSWEFEGIKASDSKRLVEIEKVFTNHVKTKPEYTWMKDYPSAIYSSALRNLAKAIDLHKVSKDDAETAVQDFIINVLPLPEPALELPGGNQ